RPTETEAADRLLVETAGNKIIAAAGAGRRPQLPLVELGRGGERFQLRLLALRPLALLRRLLRHRDPGLARQPLDRLDKIEIVGAHQKADRIAVRAAAKAVEEALVVDDVKGRRLLVVERAEPGVLAALADKPHAPPDEVGERNAAAQFIEKAGRKRHR